MIEFMKYRWFMFAISLLIIIPGVFSLVTHGLRLGIDFTGGTLWEVKTTQNDVLFTSDSVNELLKNTWTVSTVQSSGLNQHIIRGSDLTPEQHDQALVMLNQKWGPVTELRFAVVGPVLGSELVTKTVTGIVIAAIVISLYVWKQFKQVSFGLSAIMAMCHDSLVVLGVFSLLGWLAGVEVDILFVTALLTTLSFSVHDTIVVFDRIREIKRLHPKMQLEAVMNTAVIETLGRSVNNSMTIIMMLLVLTWLGGETIRLFSFALLVGAITGTYSSTFTAVPILFEWEMRRQKRLLRR